MCGILGIMSKNQISIKEVIERLKILEYRGYDSWGIAFKNPKKGMCVIKKIGSISQNKIENSLLTNIAIAHTRWATHGGVKENNAHPHISMNKEVYLVHNGIVENFKQLKDYLKSKGYEFYGDTDSEIIANLIEYEIKASNGNKDFMHVLANALKKIKGSYALAMIIQGYLVGAAKNLPLLIGINKKGKIYISSDVKSFINDVNQVYAFNDGDLVIIENHKKLLFYNIYQNKIFSPRFEEVEDVSKYGKWEPLNGYPHYTIKEIEEQKDKLYEMISYISRDVKKVVEEIKKARGIFLIGSGSSYNACLCASYLFSSIAKTHVNVVDASELSYYTHFFTPKTLVIGVSQSGETADVIESIKVAKRKGCKIIGITNVYGSTLHRLSDITILMHVGSEISVIATKTYTAQLLILIYIISILAGKEEIISRSLSDLRKSISYLLNEDFKEKIRHVAKELKKEEHLYIIGRGANYASALEGALKIKEISYIHAEAFSGGALKHGSIALISNGTYVIAIAPEDETYDEIMSNVMEVKARGGKVIGITTKHNEIFDIEILIPKHPVFQVILNIIPLQLLAYYLAVLRNLNPDKPRNLAKSVTVK